MFLYTGLRKEKLEDIEKGIIVGTSAIEVGIDKKSIIYSLKQIIPQVFCNVLEESGEKDLAWLMLRLIGICTIV